MVVAAAAAAAEEEEERVLTRVVPNGTEGTERPRALLLLVYKMRLFCRRHFISANAKCARAPFKFAMNPFSSPAQLPR